MIGSPVFWQAISHAQSLKNSRDHAVLARQVSNEAERIPAHHVRSGKDDPRFESYDRLIEEFMKEHGVPGLSIAVTNQGKLAFSQGYGYADMEAGEMVTPNSLFRIASLSKPITAVAVLQLIEQQKLALDDKVFEVLDYEEKIEAAGVKFDPRQREITIRHLLEHRGGWDRNKSFDAMFQSVRFAQRVGMKPPANQAAIIEAMFSQKLDFNPGEKYAYSNFGYCLLGRVIENLTNQDYEAYVQQHVLKPLGITQMKIGKSRLEGRSKNEVRYYHSRTDKSVFHEDLNKNVPSQYGGWFLEAMDSHGGWIASAEDLARFAAAFDDPENCPILSQNSIETMFARPPGLAGHNEDGSPKDVYYSLGWSVRVLGNGKRNHWHTGSLPGTATILIRRHDGKNFVALLNTRESASSTHLGRAIDQLLHKAADQVTDWPD